MAEINKAPRGTCDVLPQDSAKWQYVEDKMIETAKIFGFSEIRVPVFEHTEVFTKSVGDTTDVVQKEMYTFLDKGDRSITLRPELTAGVVRSVIEHGLLSGPMPLKVCYIGGCYRYEKPQAGRLREFHQFGVECFGAKSPAADAEVILLADHLLKNLGLKSYSLHINSIGCPECRKNYHAALKEYFRSQSDRLCGTCLDRLERNPMRILDCKSPVCSEIAAGAPVVLDYLCDECREHFEGVKSHLTAAGIDFSVDPHIVRGLDYYTKTVFEFVSTSLGAQSTVCGGGRYDGLIEQMHGAPTPALGFGMGIERLLMIMEAENAAMPESKKPDIYLAPMGEAAALKCTALCKALRDEGFIALTDITGRGLKAQMKYADKIGARFTMVLGDDELTANKGKIKCMESGEQTEISLDEIREKLYELAYYDGITADIDSLIK
ncbi:MAG: histidine--tRNA ligase [Clostridia bacterium]|nr:histidine--tRNA ligase [Clostridia bacterium]